MKIKPGLMYLLLLTLMAGLLAACGGDNATPAPASNTGTPGGSGTTGTGDANTIIKNSAGALAQIKDYQSTLDLTFTGQGAGTVSMDVLLKGSPVAEDTGNPGGTPQFKGTVAKSTLSTLPTGSVAVLGKSSFIYDPTTKIVLKGATGGNSEIYNLFTGSQTRSATLFSTDLTTATVAGDDKVGNFSTTKLTFTPKKGMEDSSVFGKNVKAAVWVDKASNLPVQLDYSEDGASMKWTVSNLQINKGLDDAKLSFTPPADAKVVDSSQFGKIEKVGSLAEAQSKAGFTPANPGYLPADLGTTPTGIEVQTTPLGNLISYKYSVKTTVANVTPFPNAKGKGGPADSKSINIKALKSSVNLPNNLPSNAAISDVTVQGQKGTLAVLTDSEVSLIFSKNGVFYTISSSGYGKDDVQKIGEGLK